jgi:S-adenosylmethionine:tRNA ribosyltransferase-isomerase
VISPPSFPASRLDYELPPVLIAQQPTAQRNASRLLHVSVAEKSCVDRTFAELPHLLPAGALIFLNTSRVIRARLHGQRFTGGGVELLFLEYLGDGVIQALVGSNAKLGSGDTVSLPNGWSAELLEPKALDGVKLLLRDPLRTPVMLPDLLGYLEQHGELPLPPYIKRPEQAAADDERYQTVYASAAGSVAAPTAGLHFDAAMIEQLGAAHDIRHLTLHVGAGTFAPLRVEDLADHRMHGEAYSVSRDVALEYLEARNAGRPVLAVGTTSLRTLHTLLERELTEPGWTAAQPELITGRTDAFIYPGRNTRAADLLLTNFHLPRSTLLALVFAFGGEELMRSVYAHAVSERYRFFSYGDCMLIDRGGTPSSIGEPPI